MKWTTEEGGFTSPLELIGARFIISEEIYPNGHTEFMCEYQEEIVENAYPEFPEDDAVTTSWSSVEELGHATSCQKAKKLAESYLEGLIKDLQNLLKKKG